VNIKGTQFLQIEINFNRCSRVKVMNHYQLEKAKEEIFSKPPIN
jgi:hypothetical protein